MDLHSTTSTQQPPLTTNPPQPRPFFSMRQPPLRLQRKAKAGQGKTLSRMYSYMLRCYTDEIAFVRAADGVRRNLPGSLRLQHRIGPPLRTPSSSFVSCCPRPLWPLLEGANGAAEVEVCRSPMDSLLGDGESMSFRAPT